MDPRHKILRTMGRLASERGKTAEARALEALQTDPPKWVKSVRAATLEEDARGLDLIVETDLAVLYVQVKSSRAGAATVAPRARVLVAIVQPRQETAHLRRYLLAGLATLREYERRARARGGSA